MKKVLILLLFISTIFYGQTPAGLGSGSYNCTSGSVATDEPVNVFFKEGITYVFGNTNNTTPNNDMIDPQGGTDAYCQMIGSNGQIIKTQEIGGFWGEKVIKVIQDGFGFWMFIQSSSNISGNRSVNNCFMFNASGPTASDVWMVRLDYNLNIIRQEVSCIGQATIPSGSSNSSFVPFRYKDVVKTTDNKFRILADFYLKTVSGSTTTVNGYYVELLEIDSTGNFIRNFEVVNNSSLSSSQRDKLTGNKIIPISDSVCYVLGTVTFAFSGTGTAPCDGFAVVYRLNTNSGSVNGKVMSSDKSQGTAKTGVVKNGKLHIFIEDVPVTTSSYNYYTNNFISFSSFHIRRTAPAKAITNKKDVWVVVLDTVTGLPYSAEYSLGVGSEDVDINCCAKLDDNIVLGCSTKGGVSMSKTTPSNGGLDYWIVRLDNNNNVVADLGLGGSADDIMTDMFIKNGTLIFTGKSKSGISGNKNQASYDGGVYGDAWTLGYCFTPIVSVTPSQSVVTAGNYVTFINTSQYAYAYSWYFADAAGSGLTQSYDVNPVHYYNNNTDSTRLFIFAYNLGCSSFSVVTNPVTVLPVYAGIQEVYNDSEVLIYPNPFSNVLYFSDNLINFSYVVYNAMGEKVEAGVLDKTLFLNDLKEGYYTIILNKDEKKIIKKLVKI